MYTILLNPQSGRGMALKILVEVEDLLKRRSVEYRVVRAESPEAATLIAACESQKDLKGIIVLGGDGTLFQVINGMVGSEVPLLFVPCGTGNDFIKSLNLPKEPIHALETQLDAPVSRIDVGRMNETYFLNVAGTGFDVDVLRYVDRYKNRYSGIKPYLFALYDAIKSYRPTRAYVAFEDEDEEEKSFAIVSIGNGRFIGGGMKAVPLANVQDALFDVIMVKPVRKGMILPLIAFYIAGKHVDMKLAHLRRCRRFTLRCKGMTLNLDGELHQADRAEFELLPGALKVQIPYGG